MASTNPTYAFTVRELLRMADAGQRAGTPISMPAALSGFRGAGWVDPLHMRRLLIDNGYRFKRTSIAHLNMRGGIGKTTASITLATRAAQYGFRTCLVDLDPQASATYCLAPDLAENALVTADLWETPHEIGKALIEIDPGLHLLPSSLDNSILDDEWDEPAIQKSAVAAILKELWKRGYDLVVFDAPPSLGSIVISIIAAVDRIVVPVWSDPFSIRGLELIRTEAEAIRSAFERRATAIHVLYSHYDRRVGISEELYQTVRRRWSAALLKQRIRSSSEFSKAIARRQTIFRRTRKSVATIDYDGYAREILGIPLPSPF